MAVLQQRMEDSWQVRAACRGPHTDVFYPPPQFERKVDKLRREAVAKAICLACPVRQECLDYAISIREPHGIWGGLNEAERRPMWEEELV
jgi:WhiB family redox-sensing transcriptional regulator